MKRIILQLFFGIVLGSLNCVSAQNTVGLLDFNEDIIQDGYTLLYPQSQSNVYLINNCGQVVHEWIDSTIYRPGLSSYLLEDGNLLKTKTINEKIDTSFAGLGTGAIVELRSWENEVLWSKPVADGTYRAHHDVEMMPNGNVLIIAWKRRTKQEFIQAGGDTTIFDRDEVWPDVILEYNPNLDSIVWEWDSWDHVIQDFNPSLPNFGSVTGNKGKIDLNFDIGGVGGRPDWLHFNSIDYNAALDQIIVSTAYFDEIWIIDHSTTTQEAKGDIGGDFGLGGQLLFRWGNPKTYKSGSSNNQQLFFQHDVQWLDDASLSDSEYFQMIGLFNNRVDNFQSSLSIIKPEIDLVEKKYLLNAGVYLPSNFLKEVKSSENIDFYSSNMSSMQLLPNGNFLACAAQTGTLYEFTSDMEVAWTYTIPFRNGFRIEQGADLFIGDNVMFRGKKYHTTYGAFEGKTMDPLYYLELDPNEEFCDLSLDTDDILNDVSIFPNPANQSLNISANGINITSIDVFNQLGVLIFNTTVPNAQQFNLDVAPYPEGLYYLRINNSHSFKFIVAR